MQSLPADAVREAHILRSRGVRPGIDAGVVHESGDRGRHVTHNDVWQALTLIDLATIGPIGDVSAGAPRQAVGPSFEPRSGWYQPGRWTPNSPAARMAMRAQARPSTVVVLRRRGARIPAAELLQREPATGLLLCMDRYTAPAWYACLFTDETLEGELLPRLLHARLERENDGVRLYGGIEPGDRGQPDHRQAWLCAPSPARAREILLAMLEQEGGDAGS